MLFQRSGFFSLLSLLLLTLWHSPHGVENKMRCSHGKWESKLKILTKEVVRLVIRDGTLVNWSGIQVVRGLLAATHAGRWRRSEIPTVTITILKLQFIRIFQKNSTNIFANTIWKKKEEKVSILQFFWEKILIAAIPRRIFFSIIIIFPIVLRLTWFRIICGNTDKSSQSLLSYLESTWDDLIQ